MESTRLIHFRVVHDPSGSLTPIEWADLPFLPRRVFYLHDLVGGSRRGGHAHIELREVVIALSGSFDVATVDDHGRHRWTLNRADRGLYIPPRAWRNLGNFSSNAIALVFASTEYNPKDYVRDFEKFLATLPALPEDYFTRRARAAHLWEVEK
jgi:hypothetical protein